MRGRGDGGEPSSGAQGDDAGARSGRALVTITSTGDVLCVLACGPVSMEIRSSDATAAEWLVEGLTPCFALAPRGADWRVCLSSSSESYAAIAAQRPLDAEPRACFALDQEVLAFPAWPIAGGAVVADAERACFLRVTPGRVDLFGDPRTRRWRFTSMWACQEIAATRLRRTELDLHAASVETAGRAVLIVGPKGAGKTTLSLHLLRSGQWRMMANDRTFAGPVAAAIMARGLPTAVKVRPSTLAEFPELRRGLPSVERPYLHTLDELAKAETGDAASEATDFALSPAQLAHQLGVERCGPAALGAIVFPEVRADRTGWTAERLDPEAIVQLLLGNLYGGSRERRGSTVFEDLDGGRSFPSPAVADAIAGSAPGYRVILGRGTYADPRFGERFRDVVVSA